MELSHFYGYTKDTGSPALADRTYTVLRGAFNADTRIFSFDASGQAALVIYDGNPSDDPDGLSAHFSSIVLTTSSGAGVPSLDTSVQGLIRGDSTAPALGNTAPVVNLGTALAGSAGNSAGETLTLTLSFDGPVIGLSSGTDNTIFKVGSSAVNANWSGTGNTRSLTYTIGSGQNGQAAIDEAALKQALITGLTDAAGNAFAHGGEIANIDTVALPVIDTTAPSATLTAGTGPSAASATVQSSEAGAAYLVKTGGTDPITVTSLASITSSAGGKWNRVDITAASTATSLSLTGLEDGSYSLYTIDLAGNLSDPAGGIFTVVSKAPALVSQYTVHRFTQTGTFTVSSTSPISMEALLVAGGAAGAWSSNLATGGGGGGGVAYVPALQLSSGTYAITVGAGGLAVPGAGNYTAANTAYNGGNSSIVGAGISVTVYGGGGGGGFAGDVGADGGSGGGGHWNVGTGGYARPGNAVGVNGVVFYGNSGGQSDRLTTAGGGGGGATTAGSNATPGHGGQGGQGFSSDITGTVVVYGSGGGGAGSISSGLGGTNGGHAATVGSPATSGVANTGGGGGAGGDGSAGRQNNGSGGSGVVVLRYSSVAEALASTISGTPGDSIGETITIPLTFDGPVNGLSSGINDTIFTVGGTGVAATWSGTGNTRTLTYTIAAGQSGQVAIDEVALKTALVAGIVSDAGVAFTHSGAIPNIDTTALPVVDTRAPSLTVTPAAGSQSVIHLGGAYGSLIAPIQAGGQWFYYWDRDGNSAPNEADFVPNHDFLDAIFRYANDLTSINPSVDTTDLYRFVSIGGLTLALPSLQEYQAIRTSANGLTTGWLQDPYGSYYWTATPGQSSGTHASYSPLHDSIHADDPDSYGMGVALRVISTAQPSVTLGQVSASAGNSAGETLTLNLGFDSPVVGLSSGTNSSIFTVGGTGVSATWSGTGNTRSLTYTIANGQNGQAAINEAALKTALIAGLTDLAGNAFSHDGDISNIDAAALPVVDTTAPTLSNTAPNMALGASIAGSAGNSNGETLILTLSFDSVVLGLSSGTNNGIFTVGGTGVSANWSGTGNTRSLTYTIASGQNGQAAIDEAALKQALMAGLTDAAGNAFAHSGDIANVDAVALPTIDTAGPTLSSTGPAVTLGAALAGDAGNSTGETLVLTVSFDGPVIGLSSGTSSGIFTVGGTGVSATWSGTGSTRSLTYTIASGQSGQAAIDEAALKAALIAGITDAAGNAFAFGGAIANIDAGPANTPINFGLNTSGGVDGYQSVYLIPTDGLASAVGQTVSSWSFASGGFGDQRSITPLLFERVAGNYVLRAIGSTQQAQGSTVYQDLAFNAVAGDAKIANANYFFGWKDGTQTADNGGVISNLSGSPGYWTSQEYDGQDITSQTVGNSVWFRSQFDGRNYQFQVKTSGSSMPVIDAIVPNASLTTGASPNTHNATVQSSETGTAYLVKTGGASPVTVTTLASITAADGAKWNSVAISTANSATSLSLAGLEDGAYSLYAVDAAGNLSAAASNTYSVDGAAPVLDIQYAASATASSTFGQSPGTLWSIWQILGAPDTTHEDDGKAWAPLQANNPSGEWAEVGFSSPVYAEAVVIKEIYQHGFVTRLDLVDISGNYHTVWQGVDPTLPSGPTGELPVDFKIDFPSTDYLVSKAKVYVNSLHGNSWEQIESIGLVRQAWTVTTSTLAGSAGDSTGETITLTLNFDGAVNGLSSGTNSTIFTVGGTGVSATWSGTGNTRTLTYTIASGQNGQAAINEAALKTALIAGITDAAGNAFAYSGDIPNIDVSPLPVVDTTGPTLTNPVLARYIRIYHNASASRQDILSLTGLRAMVGEVDVAANLLATASTNITAGTDSGTLNTVAFAPAALVDSTVGNAFTGQSGTASGLAYVTTTQSATAVTSNKVFIDVDLGAVYRIDNLLLWGRNNPDTAGQSDNLRVFMGTTAPGSQTYTQLSASTAFVDVGTVAATPAGAGTTVATSTLAGSVTTSTLAGSAGNSAGETITLTLNFDGSVSGLSSGTNSTIFTVGGSGVSATWSGTGNTRTLTYTITAGQNGQAAIDEAALKNALIAGITDAAGNAFAYSGSIPNIDASALPVVDTRFDAAKDFIAGPTAQSTNNIWQYFSADYSNSNLSNLAHLSDWDTNGNGLIALNQWDGNWTDANYPFVQKQTNGTLIIHPDRSDGGTGKAVVVAWKNTTASNVTVDLTGSLSLVGDTLKSFGASLETASADGITYLVTTSASVGSTPSVLLQGSLDENSGTASPSSTALSIGGQVLAPGAMISVAVHGGPTYFWDHTQLDLQITPRPTTIDLGSHGQLIAPVQVEGKWYYYWDRDKDGSALGGSISDPGDWTSHNVLDGLFNQDINGVINTTVANADGQYGTTDTYRYGTINGVRLALPTLNGEGGVTSGVAAGTAFQAPWPGTAYTDAGATSNGTTGPYGDLTAIWDAYNGTSTSTGIPGIPPGWPTSDGPWTATPGGLGHLVGALHNGGVWGGAGDDFTNYYVALQVL